MRRSTVFRLVAAALVVGVGAYTAFWWFAAGKIKDAAEQWRETAQAQKIDASWRAMRVSGYPLSFRLELSDVTLKSTVSNPLAQLQAPLLTASARPWNFHAISFAAPDGLNVTVGDPATPAAKITATRGTGAAARSDDGTTLVWLSLFDTKVAAVVPFGARVMNGWLTLPPGAPATHQDSGLAIAVDARDVALPAAPPGFGPTIDELAFGVTLMGNFPPGPLRQAAIAWRDGGGTIELDHLTVRWGEMGINGSGTLALDNELQPVGGFSGGVSGFDQLLNVLVASGRIKPADARVARLALAMLAKAGPDGRPEIASSFTIQNGQMYLGPAKLGPAPRIDW